ncbi:hypothetical protein IFR05_014455 [Cadophora sp. M221]|nr:hypothetical protein IFR05_014455 [Cadophora sp. M221]
MEYPRFTSDSGETQVHQNPPMTNEQMAARMAHMIARQWEAILAVKLRIVLEANEVINLPVIVEATRIQLLSKFNNTPEPENLEIDSELEKVESDANKTHELERGPEHGPEHGSQNESEHEIRERTSTVDEVVSFEDDAAAKPQPEPETEPKIEEIPSTVKKVKTPYNFFNWVPEGKVEVYSSIPAIIKVDNATVDEEDDPTQSIEERIERMKWQITKSHRKTSALFVAMCDKETRIQELEEIEIWEEMEATLKRKRPDRSDEPEQVPAKKPQSSTYRRPSTRKEVKPKVPKVKAPKATRRPRVASKIQKESFACTPETQVQNEDLTNATSYAYDFDETHLNKLVSGDYPQFGFGLEALVQNNYASSGPENTQTTGSEFDHPTPADTHSQIDFSTGFETQNDYSSNDTSFTGYTPNFGTQFYQSAPNSGYSNHSFDGPAGQSPNPYSSDNQGYAQNLGGQFNLSTPSYCYSQYSSDFQSQPQSTYSSNTPDSSQNIANQPYQSYQSTTADDLSRFFDSQEEQYTDSTQ